MFYIVLIIFTILLLYFYLVNQNKETFLSNTIQLTNLSIKPLRIGYRSITQNHFLESMKNYIPIEKIKYNTHEEIYNDITLDMGFLTRTLATTKYRENPEKIKYIIPLYSVYLTILVIPESKLYTYNDLLKLKRINILIVEENLKKVLSILFKGIDIEFIMIKNKFNINLREKLSETSICVIWTPENSIELNELANYYNNKFLIIKFDERTNIQMLNLEFPTLQIKKYDIRNQKCSNTEKVIFSIKNNICLYTRYNKNDNRIYKFIETLFKFLLEIRIGIKDPLSKLTLEELRPEKLIEIPIVEYHNEVIKYFKKLNIFTDEPNSICLNTMTSRDCNPKLLEDNKMRFILYGV
jgi:hypothetical protein